MQTTPDLQRQINEQLGPRVTKESIEERISCVEYHRWPATTVTICMVTMVNGFTVLGQSACVSARNFDAKVGQEIAYLDAFEKLWQLEGYLLAERMRFAN